METCRLSNSHLRRVANFCADSLLYLWDINLFSLGPFLLQLNTEQCNLRFGYGADLKRRKQIYVLETCWTSYKSGKVDRWIDDSL